MPELPEVEVVRRGLQAHVAGRRIVRVEVFSDRAVRRHPGGRADFAAILAGRTVGDIRRRGKYLWWEVDGGDAVLAHLGMSGQFRVGSRTVESPGSARAIGRRRDRRLHPHLRIRFHFADGGPDVDFLDQRTFGGMAFSPGGAELPAEIAHIGRDPLDPLFSRAAAVAAIRAKRTELKRALLDQTLVSGIGNIYADEALWRAKLHYSRPTAGLSRPAVRAVLDAATAVMSRGAGPGWHLVRQPVRQRQRRVRLLRPIAGRVRPGGLAVPAMRDADPSGAVHESLVVLLSAVPAPGAGHDRRATLTGVDLTFSGEIFYWRGPSPFHFVATPDAVTEQIATVAAEGVLRLGDDPRHPAAGRDGVGHRALAQGRAIPGAAAGQGAHRRGLSTTATWSPSSCTSRLA